MFVCSEVDYNNEGMILFAAEKEISTICSQCSDVARDYLHDLQSFHCKDLVLDIVRKMAIQAHHMILFH